MVTLADQFAILARDVEELIGLLEEADERFWIGYFKRGLIDVRAHRLAGVTYVLGCYGGAETFSDLVIGCGRPSGETLAVTNLNARLAHLRTRVFDSANAITARRVW
jgi:hypothetical protein